MVDRAFELFLEGIDPLAARRQDGRRTDAVPALLHRRRPRARAPHLRGDRARGRDAQAAAALRRVPPFVLGRGQAAREDDAVPVGPLPDLRRRRCAAVGRCARDAAGHGRDLAAGLRALPRPQRGYLERAHRQRRRPLRLPLRHRGARGVARADPAPRRGDRAHVGDVQQLQVRLRAEKRPRDGRDPRRRGRAAPVGRARRQDVDESGDARTP